MKKSELIKLIQTLPDDAEIVVNGYADDILGDYQYNDLITVNEETAHKSDKGGTLYNLISNYAYVPHEKVKVWVLE